MKMHVLNKGKEKKILCLHPIFSNASIMETIFVDLIHKDAEILIPDFNGHGTLIDKDYQSVKEEARMLSNYLVMHQVNTIDFAYGASLGALVLFELLKNKDLSFHHLYFEGAPVFSDAKAIRLLLTKSLVKKQKKAKKNKASLVKEFSKIYGEAIADEMIDTLISSREESLHHLAYDFTHVDLPNLDDEIQKKCIFAYGDQDPNLKEAKKVVSKKYPYAELKLWKGYQHCQRMTKDTKAYCKELEQAMK